MIESKNVNYVLRCPICQKEYQDDGTRLQCDACIKEKKKVILEYLPLGEVAIKKEQHGLSRFDDFIAGNSNIKPTLNFTHTYKSKILGQKYGFENLYLTCTGKDPFLDIQASTASFKELEAICVMHRLKSYKIKKPLILSSAGNTARAFAYYAAKYEHPTLLILPRTSNRYLWLPIEKGLYDKARKFIKAIMVDQPAKYLHASLLIKQLVNTLGDNVLEEGGFFNIGRICGLGTCALNFYDEVGSIPDHYIQAVGSAGGVIATLRAYKLLESEKSKKISCHVVQNHPYDPLVRAINMREPFNSLEDYRFIDTVSSPMLTSSDPALDYAGGLRDLSNSGMKIYGVSVTNIEINKAHYDLMNSEGIHPLLPAAAALAGAKKAKEMGKINSEDIVQVNITGCGEAKSKKEKGYFYIDNITSEPVPEEICYGGKLFEQWYHKIESNIQTFSEILG